MVGSLCRKDGLHGLSFDSSAPSISRLFLCRSYLGSLTDPHPLYFSSSRSFHFPLLELSGWYKTNRWINEYYSMLKTIEFVSVNNDGRGQGR